MAKKGFAIHCPHCGKWDVHESTHPEEVIVKSLAEFEGIMAEFLAAKRSGKIRDFSNPKFFRCKRPRWSCPASFEAFIFKNEKLALSALEKVPEKWGISRDFRLYKADKRSRWEGKYFCILFCTELVPRQQDIELEHLMDRSLLSRTIAGMSYEINGPLTIYAANVFRPGGENPKLFWMPTRAYPSESLREPPLYNSFCYVCRKIVSDELIEEFKDKNYDVNNCPDEYGKNNRCAGVDEPACMQESKDWNHCPAFVVRYEEKCPCANSDRRIINEIEEQWRCEGDSKKEKLVKNGIKRKCWAGFTEWAFPIVVHDHLTGVMMTGQVFFNPKEIVDVDDFVNKWSLLKGCESKLEGAKQNLLREEKKRQENGEKTRFFICRDDFKRRQELLKQDAGKIEDMANVRYRDIRSRSEDAFRQEIFTHIQKHRMSTNFFEGPILEILKWMREFWAFNVAGFLWHSCRTREVRLIGISSVAGGGTFGVGFPGNKLGELNILYRQSHPLHWVFDNSDLKEKKKPRNPWVNQFVPFWRGLAEHWCKDFLQGGYSFLVVVPLKDEAYAFVFTTRDISKVSLLEKLMPGGISELCQEFMLRTCTEIVHEFGEVRAFIIEETKRRDEQSKLLLRNVAHQVSRPIMELKQSAYILFRGFSQEAYDSFHACLAELERGCRNFDTYEKLTTDFSKARQDFRKCGSVDIMELVKEAHERVDPYLKVECREFLISKNVDAGHTIPSVIGNYESILECLVNVFHNAIKYSIGSRPVEVEVSHKQHPYVEVYPYPLSRQKIGLFKVDSSPYVKAVGTEGARRATGVPTATLYTSAGVR